MSLFVDTSALYPLLVRSEGHHEEVAEVFRSALDTGRRLVTTSYVMLETIALLQSRIGLAPVADLDSRIMPLFHVHWVDGALHRRAMELLLRRDRRRFSLVDTVSFLVMESEGVREAMALDRDFEERGFRLVPAPEDSGRTD